MPSVFVSMLVEVWTLNVAVLEGADLGSTGTSKTWVAACALLTDLVDFVCVVSALLRGDRERESLFRNDLNIVSCVRDSNTSNVATMYEKRRCNQGVGKNKNVRSRPCQLSKRDCDVTLHLHPKSLLVLSLTRIVT